MGAGRALAAAGCSHCRLAVLKLFTCPTSALPVTRTGLLQYRPHSISNSSIRSFSSHPVLNRPLNDDTKCAERNSEEKDEVDGQDHRHATEDSTSTSTPWYLQVDPPRHVASLEQPPLPEVPEQSPEIIAPLLKYASEEMGLDDISLLDLRRLDPPPALGPNLFMLFGTARSTRHLNVSAGRLVRWLRAEHRIWADTDGLLGPNERKTKLRRKAKRAKLLGTMGTDDADDGIKTGWICVNLGTRGRGSRELDIVAEDGRIAGFGVPQNGSTIVVQIMTESRRAELGLETLWQQALDQQLDQSSEPKAEKPRDLHPLEEAILSSRSTPQSNRHGGPSRNALPGQARFYSTEQAVSRDPSKTSRPFPEISTGAFRRVLSSDAEQKHRFLQLLCQRLDQLSPVEAADARGDLSRGQMSPAFLQVLEFALQNLPPYQTWGYRLTIQSKAHHSSSNNFKTLQQLVEEMRIYSIAATRQQFLRLLACIYGSVSVDLRTRSKLALELLEIIQQRGQPILDNDIIVTIIEAAVRTGSRDSEVQQLMTRLQHLSMQADLPCMTEPLLMRLMEVYARTRNFPAFWDTWRIPPRYLRPRSAAMYIHLYKLAAASHSTSLCAITIRRCFQEMLLENPSVQPTGHVLDALMDCIRVADPHAEEHAQILSPASDGVHSAKADREFVKLVRHLKGLI
ncbi:hypothetical protein F4779DRAFT_9591 [Xylariaceae sp. FL0662B]|nr:hypothetical protein F4779DRAFT_9591 [Xylariaceae sp. FL0662B]